MERTSKTIGKIGTGSKSFEALIKALYLQTLELFPNGLIMEEQLHIFGSLVQASINNAMKTLDLFSQPIFLVEMIWYL